MDWKHRGPQQEGPEPPLLPGEAAADVPPVCGGQRYLTVYAAVFWGRSVRARDANKLHKLDKKADSVVGGGAELDSLEAVAEKRMLSKLVSMLNNISRPLHDMLVEKKSVLSQRLIPYIDWTLQLHSL